MFGVVHGFVSEVSFEGVVCGVCYVVYLRNKTTHNTKHENTHPQVYTNLNVMTVPNTILVKQVDPSKHDILNI